MRVVVTYFRVDAWIVIIIRICEGRAERVRKRNGTTSVSLFFGYSAGPHSGTGTGMIGLEAIES